MHTYALQIINVAFLLRMPKKGKRQGKKAVAAEADDDFDAMLAALRAADPVTPVASSSSTAAEKRGAILRWRRPQIQ
jgi:hypothetical protein